MFKHYQNINAKLKMHTHYAFNPILDKVFDLANTSNFQAKSNGNTKFGMLVGVRFNFSEKKGFELITSLL